MAISVLVIQRKPWYLCFSYPHSFTHIHTQTHTQPWATDDAEEKQQHNDMSGLATNSHRFCIIGVRLRFPYCLMCEQQPEATQRCAVCKCVDILYITYLTSPVKEVRIKQTDADRHTGTYSHICTLIGTFEGYVALHVCVCVSIGAWETCRNTHTNSTRILPSLSSQSSTSRFQH